MSQRNRNKTLALRFAFWAMLGMRNTTAHAQVNPQEYATLKAQLKAQKTFFSSVSATVHEKIRVTHPRKLRHNEEAWGDVNGERQYKWDWSNDKMTIAFDSKIVITPPKPSTFLQRDVTTQTGSKAYELSQNLTQKVFAQGSFGSKMGRIPMPSDFAYELEEQWFTDVLDRFDWKELKRGNDPQWGEVAILSGASPRGTLTLTFSAANRYLCVRQEHILDGHLTEDIVKTIGLFQNIPFPTEMAMLRHETETKDSLVDRMRTLTVKNLVFNKTPATAFDMKWPEGAIVSDRDNNIVYEIVHGRMVVSRFSKNRPANEMLTGLMFLGSFTVLGLLGVRFIVRRGVAARA